MGDVVEGSRLDPPPGVMPVLKGRGVRPVGPIKSVPNELRMAAVVGPGVGKRPFGSEPRRELWINGERGPGRNVFGPADPEVEPIPGTLVTEVEEDTLPEEVARLRSDDDKMEVADGCVVAVVEFGA